MAGPTYTTKDGYASSNGWTTNTVEVSPTGVSPPGVTIASGSRSVMTRRFGPIERPPAYCGDCCGKGFALDQGKNRHSRKCPRCRGKGAVNVGSTKR